MSGEALVTMSTPYVAPTPQPAVGFSALKKSVGARTPTLTLSL